MINMAKFDVSIPDELNDKFRASIIEKKKKQGETPWERGYLSEAVRQALITYITLDIDEIQKMEKEWKAKNE